LLEHRNFRYIDGDILDLSKLRKAMQDVDIVIHLASIAGVGMVVAHPVLTLKINLIGSYHVLECVRELKKVERYIDFSTSEVYGPHVYKADEDGMTTQGPIGQPRWIYAVGKLASEHLSHSYYREYGIPCVSIRPFNVYGPRQQGEGAVHHFVKNAILNQDLIVHDDGNQVRSWIYIDDFVEGVLL
ncbi:MAG: SDR family oxidoreductase, partial [candidate division KSB1 bacterium]|nr:SDR family oxidoreductase [candidate division KSB1 bacterium]